MEGLDVGVYGRPWDAWIMAEESMKRRLTVLVISAMQV
jgi:hypothetical protein